MKVFYRISPYLSSNPNPLGKDKNVINFKCLMSFLEANKGFAQLNFIVDSLDEAWVNDYLKPYGEVIYGHHGNVETFHDQLDEVCKLPNEEIVFLVEDDYMWRPESLKTINRAVEELLLVSPYDHPGHYLEDRFKFQPKQMRMIENQVYRQAPSNTLTFATKAFVIKQNIELIKKFGIRDHDMFTELGIDLWVPVPSIATHMVKGLISAPFVENP